jgi:hypothetical protein
MTRRHQRRGPRLVARGLAGAALNMRIPELRALAGRRLAVLAVALVCISCTAPAAQESHPPSGTAAATATAGVTPTAAQTPSLTPIAASSASPSVLTGFQYSDVLRVEVNGLAVRQAPLLTSPLAQAYRFDGVRNVPLGDVRLNAGDFVSVHLGPLPVGDTVWYLVRPAEDARLGYSTVAWDAGSGVGPGDPGWVAASVGLNQYLTLQRRPEASEIEQSLPVGVTVSGTGDYESGPQPRHDMFLFNWAAAVIDGSARCAFSVTLLPDDGSEPVAVAVQTSTTNVAQGALQGPAAVASTPWAPTPAGGPGHSFTVSIKSGCAWAVGLHSLAHD